MACLTQEQIERLAAKELAPAEAAALQAHVDRCKSCGERIEGWHAWEELLGDVRRLPGDVFTAVSDECETQAALQGDSTTVLAAADPEGAPLPRLPGYRLLRELSHGAQGVVYEAIQESTKRKVALKVLLPGIHASKRARKRFEREIEIIAQLRHANIVSIHDAARTPEGRYYYAMDYVRGLPLHRHVREQSLSLEATLSLFMEICDALQYAHQRGVIHRDLKPTNILVDADGSPKVLDFGLAKQLASKADTLSLTEQIVGTLPYMAPEQTRGNPDEIDTRTDVYALGVILYELLTGKYPYPVVGELADVLRHIAETPPERPSQAWLTEQGVPSKSVRRRSQRCPIPNDLETIVLKALAKENTRRYQSAGELGRDVDRFLRGEPIEAKRDSALYLLRKMARQHRSATAAMLSLLVILISTGWISVAYQRRAWVAEAEHEKTVKQLRQSEHQLGDVIEGKLLDPIRSEVLPWFLLEWQAGRDERAQAILEMVSQESPQHRVMAFLLDEQRRPEELLIEMPEQYRALALFAIGERHMRAQRLGEAHHFYSLCMKAEGPSMIKAAAKSRLSSLEPQPTGEAGAELAPADAYESAGQGGS